MTSLIVARTRSPEPHWPVRKKNGTSMRSKKTTKSARSCAVSAPSTAVSASAEVQEEEARPLPLAQRRPDVLAIHSTVVEEDEEEVQPVDAELPVDARARRSTLVRDELQAGSPRLSKSATATIA